MTARRSPEGIPVSWIKHRAEQLRLKGVKNWQAELQAREELLTAWAQTGSLKTSSSPDPNPPSTAA